MRFDFDGPEFPGAFVEFSDAWSVGEKRRIFEVQGDEFYSLLRRKVTALSLPVMEGEQITAPDQLTHDSIDGLDGRLWDWFRGTVGRAILELGNLGEAMRRRLSTSDTKPEN